MALHRLTHITLGVPDIAATAAFYREFGLTPTEPRRGIASGLESGSGSTASTSMDTSSGSNSSATTSSTLGFSTTSGGEQLRLTPAAKRGLIELGIGVEAPDDLDRIASAVTQLGVTPVRVDSGLRIREPASGLVLELRVAPTVVEPPVPRCPCNAPGRTERRNQTADGVLRQAPVQPVKLSHIAIGTPDHKATTRFLTDGLGFAVSDSLGFVSFLRCSQEHHNIAVQQGPGGFLHHTAWEVADIDEVGRGGAAMVAANRACHLWGLGRHAIGSNFFWYLRDPAGNFAEYMSDLDRITDSAEYRPPAWAGPQAVYAWAPPIPPDFLAPPDLASLLA